MVFRRNTFATKHVSIGSEESGGVSNITIEDCVLGEDASATAAAAAGGSTAGGGGGGGGGSALPAGIHLKAERGQSKTGNPFLPREPARGHCWIASGGGANHQ